MYALYLFLSLVELLIVARVVLSFLAPASRQPVVQFIRSVTDPILEPVASILPRTGMFDFSPMVVILVIHLLKGVVGGMR